MFSRRKFFKTLGVISGALVLPARLVFAKKLSLSLEKVKALKEIGGSKTLKIKGKKIMFIRDSETTIRAFEPVCTHKGCAVTYNKDSKRIECPCHQSIFKLDGTVEKGPASVPLKTFESALEDGKIQFSLD